MIADSTPDSGQNAKRHSIAIDERAISQVGWLTLDLSATRGIPLGDSAHIPSGPPVQPGDTASRAVAADDADVVLPLGAREMAAAAMLRAVQAQSGTDAAEAGQGEDATRRAWRLAREARALARARGQLPQGRAGTAPGAQRDPAETGPGAVSSGAVPASAIIPVGGSDLQAFTPAQPFPRDDKAANDNRGRMLLMTALLVGISAGYAMTAKTTSPAREGFDIPAPLAPEVRVSRAMPLPGDASPAGAFAIFPALV